MLASSLSWWVERAGREAATCSWEQQLSVLEGALGGACLCHVCTASQGEGEHRVTALPCPRSDNLTHALHHAYHFPQDPPKETARQAVQELRDKSGAPR